ncbi:MAG: PqqD family protein [Betaproteobacteria bacterium]|nr:PqqD family protein [Betaproteobacteria bacterium]
MVMTKNAVELLEAQTLRRLALSDSGFVFDPVTGSSFTLNASGLAILRQMQKETDIAQVIEGLKADFEVDAPTLERDLAQFAVQLRTHFK